MNHPQSMWLVGKFVGVHPVRKVNEDFFTQDFAIDTEAKYNPIVVLQATKTAITDVISELEKFRPGDLVKVSLNIRSHKTADGKWFTNVSAWKIQAYVPQDTRDFAAPARDNGFPVATEADPQFTGGNHAAAAAPAVSGADDLPF